MANTTNLAKGKRPKHLVLVDGPQANDYSFFNFPAYFKQRKIEKAQALKAQQEKARAEFDHEAYARLRAEAAGSLKIIIKNVRGFEKNASYKDIPTVNLSDLKLATKNFVLVATDELFDVNTPPSIEAATVMRDNIAAVEQTFAAMVEGNSEALTASFKRVEQLAKKTEARDPDLQEFANAMKYVVAACYIVGAVITLTALAFAPATGGFSAFLCIPGVLAMAAGAVIEKSVQPTGRKPGLPRAMSYFADQTKVVNRKIIHADTLAYGMRR